MNNKFDISKRAGMQYMTTLIARGTFILILLMLCMLLLGFLLSGKQENFQRFIISGAIAVPFGVIMLYLSSTQLFSIAAWQVIIFYLLLSNITFLLWGISTPIGLLILGLLVIVSGAMRGINAMLVVAFLSIGSLVVIQWLYAANLISPDYTQLATEPNFRDVTAYSAIILIISLVAWLSRRQIENSLHRALTAEQQVIKEKRSLALKLEKRTKELKKAQLEEMQQLYQFAEAGRASTTVLHELANHLTVLTLSIDELAEKRHSKELDQAKESIDTLENMIGEARRRLVTTSIHKPFIVYDVLQEVAAETKEKAESRGVTIKITESRGEKGKKVSGDSLYFSQIMRVLLNNAIDAYAKVQKMDKTVYLKITSSKKEIIVSVVDDGEGIPLSRGQDLFKVHKSSKPHGMGIGLYIARELAKSYFDGELIYTKPLKHSTQFNLVLSRKTK